MNERVLTPTYSAARGLLVMDIIILNHGQVTRTTLELEPLCPNFHVTPAGGRLSIDRFNSTRWVFSGTRLELMTRKPRVRYLDHWATPTWEVQAYQKVGK
ncbi:hypothetical protein TNCV_2354231 [Trichonephila clavipes]|nr:hypothetical protein TNCV_2354231 [Trichonephila clavipes]